MKSFSNWIAVCRALIICLVRVLVIFIECECEGPEVVFFEP